MKRFNLKLNGQFIKKVSVTVRSDVIEVVTKLTNNEQLNRISFATFPDEKYVNLINADVSDNTIIDLINKVGINEIEGCLFTTNNMVIITKDLSLAVIPLFALTDNPHITKHGIIGVNDCASWILCKTMINKYSYLSIPVSNFNQFNIDELIWDTNEIAFSDTIPDATCITDDDMKAVDIYINRYSDNE